MNHNISLFGEINLVKKYHVTKILTVPSNSFRSPAAEECFAQEKLRLKFFKLLLEDTSYNAFLLFLLKNYFLVLITLKKDYFFYKTVSYPFIT